MRSKQLVGLMVAASVTLASASAFAETAYFDPFGSAPTTAYIGTDPNDGNTQWIGWKNKNTNQCAWHQIGDGNGLWDYTEVWSDNGNNDITVLSTTISWCGYTLSPPIFGGYWMELFGGDNNDRLISASTYDVWLWAGSGADFLESGRADALLAGGPGNDSLSAHGAGSGHYVYGEDGDDCVHVSSLSSPALVSCGNGSDQWWGVGSRPSDCETTQCECGVFIC